MQRLSNSQFKNLKKQKHENRFLLFLDNTKIIKDAIAGGLEPKLLLVEKEEYNLWGDKYPVYLCDRKMMEQLSDSKTPQGVLCLVEYIQDVVEKPKTNFLVLDGLQDPGNVGTLIRTATACGFETIYLLDCVHVTNPKLIRSSVGTIFSSKNIEVSRDEFIKLTKKWDLHLIKADMNGENVFKADFEKLNKNGFLGVVVGNEGQGVSKDLSKLCKYNISIPMKNNVESLNASVSGSIIMYQIAKSQFQKS